MVCDSLDLDYIIIRSHDSTLAGKNQCVFITKDTCTSVSKLFINTEYEINATTSVKSDITGKWYCDDRYDEAVNTLLKAGLWPKRAST